MLVQVTQTILASLAQSLKRAAQEMPQDNYSTNCYYIKITSIL